jgi:hypothetical protein
MLPWLGVSGAPCPNDAAGYLRTTSSRGDPPGTVGLRMVAEVPKSIVRKIFRLSGAFCNVTRNQKISADHLYHDPTTLGTHPVAFHPGD